MGTKTYSFVVKAIGLIWMCGAMITSVAAQDTDIGTETVTVVKPYTPTVSDAFKIKSDPSFNDSIVLQKKPIKYTIFSVPVASTFTPAKGRAAAVEKAKPEKLFNTYAAFGLGNYNNAMLEFYTSKEIDRGDERFDVGLNHHSSRGDIDNTPLDTDFYNTDILLAYDKRDRDMNWGARLNAGHKLYHWYGLGEGALDEATLSSLDVQQQYYSAEASGHLNFEEATFRSGEITLRRFWDAVESGENRIIVTPALVFPVTEERLELNFKLDYVGGEFANGNVNNTSNDGPIKYGQFQAGVNPSLVILRDELTLNLGANIVYGLETEASDSNFYIYPAVSASYRLADDLAIAYGGVEGNLVQNSYFGLVNDNPFVSPTLTIQPTDQQYEAYLGLKGQLFANLSYNIKGSYSAQNRVPLFKLNPSNSFRDDEKAYYYGNSFEVFYDDLKTLAIFGELNVDVNRDFSLGVNGSIYDYSTETGNPAWNLANVEASVFMDYQLGDSWFLGANLFFIGEREDLRSQAEINTPPQDFPNTVVTLDSFFDANAHVGYRLNDQLSIFAKASNIANNQYQRWADFRVQGFQVLGGVSYKFDL